MGRALLETRRGGVDRVAQVFPGGLDVGCQFIPAVVAGLLEIFEPVSSNGLVGSQLLDSLVELDPRVAANFVAPCFQAVDAGLPLIEPGAQFLLRLLLVTPRGSPVLSNKVKEITVPGRLH